MESRRDGEAGRAPEHDPPGQGPGMGRRVRARDGGRHVPLRALHGRIAGGEAEERRLFYVAVTRARNELILCAPEIRRGPDGRPTYAAPSRFLREIPQEMLGRSSALY